MPLFNLDFSYFKYLLAENYLRCLAKTIFKPIVFREVTRVQAIVKNRQGLGEELETILKLLYLAWVKLHVFLHVLLNESLDRFEF